MTLPLEPGAPTDFDFIVGCWQVRHQRLRERLCGCNDWDDFGGRSSTVKTLGGHGVVEDNWLDLPTGPVRALALRSYCQASRRWSIWWLDGRRPLRLDPPVVGGFDGPVGRFFGDDELDGRPIRVRFVWTAEPGRPPRWEQAFSADGGATWETNWRMVFTPAADSAGAAPRGIA